MIFYFSGSGNSYATAKKIADATNDTLVNIADAMYHQKFAYILQTGEKLGFVFPVYAWAPPKIVEQFIQHLELYHDKQTYIYAVCTCGQSIGETMYIFDAALRAKRLKLCSGFSVVMPDNYAVLCKAPSLQEQQQILSQADTVIGCDHSFYIIGTPQLLSYYKGKIQSFVKQCGKSAIFARFATKQSLSMPQKIVLVVVSAKKSAMHIVSQCETTPPIGQIQNVICVWLVCNTAPHLPYNMAEKPSKKGVIYTQSIKSTRSDNHEKIYRFYFGISHHIWYKHHSKCRIETKQI